MTHKSDDPVHTNDKMTNADHFASPFDRTGHLRMPASIAGSELCDRPAGDLAADIAARRLSSVEVVTAFLDRIDALNPVYNAIVSLRERADILNDAQAADASVAAGEVPGLLHGLPIAIKDLAPTKGLRTTFGSPVFANHVPAEDGIAVGRIKAAGAIVIGKTNTPEFGLGSHTFNPVHGATGNAFDPSKSAGGSSGGAAVALATRMLPLADGSDMGGSLRNPAAFNNVFGLRPSFGRVPSLPSGHVFEASLSTDGPMARSAEDLGRLLDVMSGADPRVPLSSGLNSIAPAEDDDFSPAIAWLADCDGHLAIEAGILDCCESALAKLKITGGCVDTYPVPFDMERLWHAFTTLRHAAIAGSLGALFENSASRNWLKPEMIFEIENGRALTALDVYVANETRTAWHLVLVELFERFDLIALPAAQVWPFDITLRWPTQIAGKRMDSYHRWMECIVSGTMSGCPVLSLPAGFRNGLSTGVQLIAPHGREDLLLSMAHRYENAS